jgi:hypothetical protein
MLLSGEGLGSASMKKNEDAHLANKVIGKVREVVRLRDSFVVQCFAFHLRGEAVLRSELEQVEVSYVIKWTRCALLSQLVLCNLGGGESPAYCYKCQGSLHSHPKEIIGDQNGSSQSARNNSSRLATQCSDCL